MAKYTITMPLSDMMFDGSLTLLQPVSDRADCWQDTRESSDLDTTDIGCVHMACRDCFWSHNNMERLTAHDVEFTTNGSAPNSELKAKGLEYIKQLRMTSVVVEVSDVF